jgi:23S rRNA (uracil1939-C5)-methyltransferase
MAETVELMVERIGAGGDGVARWRDEPVFLPFAAPGDRVRVRLGARRGGGHEGRVSALLAAGPGRVEPACPHFGRCGGCALQHLDPALYREAKLDRLRGALRRAGIDPGIVMPLRAVPPARRRARLGLIRPRDPRRAAVVGFRERLRHELVDLRECPVLEPALLALAGGLRPLAADLLAPGGTAEALLARTDSGIDLLLEMSEPPGQGALEALAEFAEARDLARIVWRTRRGDILVAERRTVRIVQSGIPVPFPPGAFLQPSEAAARILVAEVLAGVGAARPAVDLYAGLGVFALALARAGPVHAVEGDARAAAALASAASAAPGLTVERRDLARDPLPAALLARYAAAVLDPPRAGAARQAAALATSAVETIVSVSCNPATFARDAALLIGGGFRLEKIEPVDQFVWSPHLELVGVFRR